MDFHNFAIELLDDVLGAPAGELMREEKNLNSLGFLPRGRSAADSRKCINCKGIMHRTNETGRDGQPTGTTLWVCDNTACGTME